MAVNRVHYDEDFPQDRVDKRRSRRKKARRRMVFRLLTLLIVGILVVTAWQNWDTLAPDKLIAKFQDSFGGGAGSYPVDVSGTNAQRLVRCQNYTVLLSDSYLTFYNDTGGEVKRYICSHTNSLLRHAGRYVLLVEQEGRQVQLFTRSAPIIELTTSYDILSAAVNSKGQMAVLTQGPQGYAVQVTVYDRRGKVLYTRSRNQQATEVALSPDGKQVALLSVQAENGNLNTTLDVFALDSAAQEAVCSYKTADKLLYRAEYLTDGWLAAVGEGGAVLLNTADGLATVYAPEGKRLLGYAAGDTTLALVMREYGDTGDGVVQIVDKKGEPLCTVEFTGDFRHLSAQGRQYLLLTDSAVQEITTLGAGRKAASAADGQQAVLCGDSGVVLGLNLLQAYPLGKNDQ